MAEKTTDNINRTANDFYQRALAALERNNLDYAIEMFLQCLLRSRISRRRDNFSGRHR